MLQSQTVIREKLRKTLWYKKAARKMLMKLTPEQLPSVNNGHYFCIPRGDHWTQILLYFQNVLQCRKRLHVQVQMRFYYYIATMSIRR